MPLSVGERLGPYEILALIGKGGMGEVYRARDPRLNRDVAIKISNAQFTERFTREARAIAALNHTNICHLYDVGPDYLVMEYVEGQDLRGPLDFDDALPIVQQLIDGIEAAHEKNIVHRDLKPANIKITPEGVVKILDFGLAKAMEPPSENSNPENSPTLTMGATVAGTVLGTAAYMAPEQAKGKAADRRSDIWSFGVIVYEVLTGKRLFQGESAVEILGGVLNQEPDISTAPQRVHRLLRWCLEKDRKQRLASISDARRLMAEDIATPGDAAPSRLAGAGWLAAGMLAVIAAIAVAVLMRTLIVRDTPERNFVFTVLPRTGIRLGRVGQGASEKLSPDGSIVVYRGNRGLQLRRLDSLRTESLSGTESVAGAEFWSPNSKSVAFPVVNGLMRMNILDGVPELIAKSDFPARGGSWGEKGTILVASNGFGKEPSGLFAVEASGGKLQRMNIPNLKEGRYYNPEFLPGGEDFLFLFAPEEAEEAEIYLATLREGKVVEAVLLFKNDTAVAFTRAGGGYVLFVRNDNLYAQKLDIGKRKLDGDPLLVQQGVASGPITRSSHISVSNSGTLIWRAGQAAQSQVTVFDRHGQQIETAGAYLPINYIRLSPDETRIAAGSEAGAWLLEPGHPGRINLGGHDFGRVWSPDGMRVMGRSSLRIVERSLTGSKDIREVAVIPSTGNPQDISPDGKVLLTESDRSLYAIRLDIPPRDRVPAPVVQTEDVVTQAQFSPDGRTILYTARNTQAQPLGLFLQPYPGSGLRKQIANSGTYAYWRADGKEILYYDEGRIWSIRVEAAGSDVPFNPPEPLFSIPEPVGLNFASKPLAVSRDGSRIYFLKSTEQPADSDVIYVRTGWPLGRN